MAAAGRATTTTTTAASSATHTAKTTKTTAATGGQGQGAAQDPSAAYGVHSGAALLFAGLRHALLCWRAPAAPARLTPEGYLPSPELQARAPPTSSTRGRTWARRPPRQARPCLVSIPAAAPRLLLCDAPRASWLPRLPVLPACPPAPAPPQAEAQGHETLRHHKERAHPRPGETGAQRARRAPRCLRVLTGVQLAMQQPAQMSVHPCTGKTPPLRPAACPVCCRQGAAEG